MLIVNSVIRSAKSSFDITQDDIESFEHAAIGVTVIDRGDHLVMATPRCDHAWKTA